MTVLDIPSEAWFPVLTLLLGAAANAIISGLSDRRAERRDKEGRHEQRREAALLRRIEFQRRTLLDLQEASAKLARMAGAAHHHDVMAARSGAGWRRSSLPSDVNEGALVANRDVALLLARVRDERIRHLASGLKSVVVDSLLSQNEAVGNNALLAMSGILDELNARIGEVLRTLDDDEDAVVK